MSPLAPAPWASAGRHALASPHAPDPLEPFVRRSRGGGRDRRPRPRGLERARRARRRRRRTRHPRAQRPCRRRPAAGGRTAGLGAARVDLGDLPFTPLDSGQTVDVAGFEVRRSAPAMPPSCRARRSAPTSGTSSRLTASPSTTPATRSRPPTSRDDAAGPHAGLVAEDRGGDRLPARRAPGPGGRHPRRPGQRPGARQHQPLAGHRGRRRLPLARTRHHARRGRLADAPASASSGSSSRPRTSTPPSPSTATRWACRSSSTSPATVAST